MRRIEILVDDRAVGLAWAKGEAVELRLVPEPPATARMRLTIAHFDSAEPFIEFLPSIADSRCFQLAPQSVWHLSEGHAYHFEIWQGAEDASPSRISRGTIKLTEAVPPTRPPSYGDDLEELRLISQNAVAASARSADPSNALQRREDGLFVPDSQDLGTFN